tara:strand:+ start:2132 stop:3418 length:1287 start_codon:yes stop_codon:yes gene_type:complete
MVWQQIAIGAGLQLVGSMFGRDTRQDNQNNINLKFEQANEAYSFDRATDWVTYYNTLEKQYVDDLNSKAMNAYKEQLAFNNWQDKENMRLYSYAKEAEAYNASVEAYYEQLDFNDIAEELTIADTERAYQDKLLSIGFQNEELLTKYYEGGKELALETRGLTQGLKEARKASKLQIKEVGVNREMDLLNDALDKAGLRDGMAATKADAAFKVQGMRSELLQKEGQIRNLGQVGRSAEKAMQAVLSNHGNAQMALYNSVANAESKYSLDLQKLAGALKNKTEMSQLQLNNITNALVNAETQIAMSEEGTGLKFSSLQSGTQSGQKQLKQSLISAGEQNLADRNKIGMDKYQADVKAAGALKSRPSAPPQQKLPLLLPDTVYQKPMKPIDKPLPVRGLNTVHNTGFKDIIMSAGSSLMSAGISKGVETGF